MLPKGGKSHEGDRRDQTHIPWLNFASNRECWLPGHALDLSVTDPVGKGGACQAESGIFGSFKGPKMGAVLRPGANPSKTRKFRWGQGAFAPFGPLCSLRIPRQKRKIGIPTEKLPVIIKITGGLA